MSQILVYLLLALALLLPIIGAVALRIFGPQISERVGVTSGVVVFGIAIISALLLARSEIGSLQLGRLTLLLPVTRPAAAPVLAAGEPNTPLLSDNTPATAVVPPVTATIARPGSATAAVVATATRGLTATRAATPSALPAPSATRAARATSVVTPTLTRAPTATPLPTAEPTVAATATAPAGAAERRTYVVQEGDTLGSIARRFNVSVADLLEANNLTPQQGDTIRPGQELVIP